jgi:hypothetical protein
VNTTANFIDVLPKATDKDLKNPLDFIDVNVVIAVREHTNHITRGHIGSNERISVAVRSLAPKAFENYADPATALIHVPLSKYGEKSQFLCRQTQLFKPALKTPVVHPSHVYIACVALRVRRAILQDQITIPVGPFPTEQGIRDSLISYRDTAITRDIQNSDLNGQLALLESADLTGTDVPVNITPNHLRDYHRDVLARHRREMASLPANIIDADTWLADWFDACTPAFPDSAAWLTKALMWRDMACKTRG